ncbi:hypothetical protein DIPPA_26859 [Diplonema papillatum]|nr:hypothetical protein DIPPA_26859 [Diplonema papillatum]
MASPQLSGCDVEFRGRLRLTPRGEAADRVRALGGRVVDGGGALVVLGNGAAPPEAQAPGAVVVDEALFASLLLQTEAAAAPPPPAADHPPSEAVTLDFAGKCVALPGSLSAAALSGGIPTAAAGPYADYAVVDAGRDVTGRPAVLRLHRDILKPLGLIRGAEAEGKRLYPTECLTEAEPAASPAPPPESGSSDSSTEEEVEEPWSVSRQPASGAGQVPPALTWADVVAEDVDDYACFAARNGLWGCLICEEAWQRGMIPPFFAKTWPSFAVVLRAAPLYNRGLQRRHIHSMGHPKYRAFLQTELLKKAGRRK